MVSESLLTFACIVSCVAGISINKCCPEGQRLHKIVRKPKCVDADVPESSWMPDLEGSGRELFPINITYGRRPCDPEDGEPLFHSDVLKKEQFRIFDNGTLFDADDNAFPPASFCVDRVHHNSTTYVAILCPCQTVGCVRVCCADDTKIFDYKARKCVKTDRNIARELPVYTEDFRTKSSKKLFYLHQMPRCDPKKRYVLNWSDGNAFSETGSLKATEYQDPIPSNDYCWASTNDALQPLLIICFPAGAEELLHYKLYSALFIFGAVFLLATFLVHALLPEMRNLHGKNLMAHTASLFVAYIALASNQLAGPKMPDGLCILSGFVIQFTFLAAFFWLNVMCIDISWAFSGLRPPQGSATERDRKKFIYYSLYAWGSTAIISIVTIFMDFAPGIPNTMLKPNLGKNRCWFKEKMAILAYFYGPMAALLLINLILFAYTATKIVAVRRDTAVLNKGNSSRHEGTSRGDKQRLVLYVKLFVLMGLSWITEIISWAVGGHDYYWYATDIVNLLLAVFIFIIFVCKKKVLCLLQNRFPWLKFKFLNNQTRGSSPTQSTSLSPNSISMTNLNTATTINTKTS